MSPAITVSKAQQNIEALLPHLESARKFESKPWPVRSNYASQMGHPCERFLYHNRHDWDKAIERDWGGVGIRGTIIADWWKIYMMQKGFDIVRNEEPLSDEMVKKYQIGGRIDGRIGKGEVKPMLYEFKTMMEHEYNRINTYEDFQDSKSDYIRGYPAQIQIYLLSMNEEAGWFVLCNPMNLAFKFIPVYLDYGYTEWLLKRAERVNRANVAGTPPDRIAYGKTCERCKFQAICLPDIKNEGFEMVDDDALKAFLDERAELKEAHTRYEFLDDEAKTMSKKIGKDFLVGSDWAVQFKNSTMRRIDTKALPPEIKLQYEKETPIQKITFVPLGK